MKAVYIKADGLGLDLPLYTQEQRSYRVVGVLAQAAFSPPKREWRTTLDDITFHLGEGDRLALVGRNGAGKTTLLKVLIGAYPIGRGSLDIVGSRQALLNLSLGFDPECTLVENILLRGVAMGVKPRKMTPLVPEILEFSELEDRAGHRLRTLSSGQRLRLGFSLATSVEHDILLMDEWIGTGDAWFVEKAKARLKERVANAKIVVLASHNLELLSSVCNKGLFLKEGRVVTFGAVDEVIRAYQRSSAT